MSQGGQIVLVGILALCGGVYCFYTSRNKQKLRKISDSIVKSGFFFINSPDYAEEYFRLMYTVGGFFFIICGIISLLTRTEFSHTVLGKYIFYFLVSVIFAGGIGVIIYSNLRFRKK